MTDKMLSRSVPFTLTRSEGDSDGLTLEGYAAVFDTPTRINSWEGEFDEQITHGAFTKAVRANPKPVLQFDHGTHPLLGSIPIGRINKLREDDKGLFVSARLSDNWLIEPVRDAIRDEAVTGMSFRFTVPPGGDEWNHDTDDDIPLRTLTSVDLHELGPVVWPAYRETEVSVRSQNLATMLEDDDTRHALAEALMLATVTDDEDTDNDTEVVEDETRDTETNTENDTPTAEPDTDDPAKASTENQDSRPSAPTGNPARHAATLMDVRLGLAMRRSKHLGTNQVPLA